MEWSVVDHVCRQCLGRVLVGIDDQGQNIARCADCGFEAVGETGVICACGTDLGSTKVLLQCAPNPHITPSVPAQVIVIERAAP